MTVTVSEKGGLKFLSASREMQKAALCGPFALVGNKKGSWHLFPFAPKTASAAPDKQAEVTVDTGDHHLDCDRREKNA